MIKNHEKLRISLEKSSEKMADFTMQFWGISWETKKGNEWKKWGFHWIPVSAISGRFLGDKKTLWFFEKSDGKWVMFRWPTID